MLILQIYTLATPLRAIKRHLSRQLQLATAIAVTLSGVGTSAWAQELSPSKVSIANGLIAQASTPGGLQIPSDLPSDQDIIPRSPESLPEQQPLPNLRDLLAPFGDVSPSQEVEAPSPADGATLCVQRFHIERSTVFSAQELDKAILNALEQEEILPRDTDSDACDIGELTFSEILVARTAVTQLYLDNGYVTSGAILPANTPFTNGVVSLRAIEGRLEDIQVNGTRRLQSSYVSSRLGIAAKAPLNQEKLLQGLQLLQLNPLIQTIRADLQAGTVPGANLLVVDVIEEDSFDVAVDLNNSRSPSVGSFRRGISVRENNLLGLGDAIAVGYVNTAGSNEFNGRYTLPVSPYDTTLTLAASIADNNVIEDPFDELDISSDSSNYSITLEHPLIREPSRQLDLGIGLSRQFSQTELGIFGPFPLSAGADNEGKTVTSTLRFSQAWTQRDTKQVTSLRSQFSLGLGNFLNGTINNAADLPDNNFFAWQGQAQWVRGLGGDALFLLRGGVQLTGDSLLSSEKFGLGGQATVRGYRQEELLTDNGLQASAEVRFPILRIASLKSTVQAAPFIDFGHGWNESGFNPDPNTLIGVGAGLIWEQPNLNARLDWGIPLISASDGNDSLQESGIYFSVQYSFL